MSLAFWDKIMDRPRGQRIGLWIGSVVFIGYVFWQYGVSGLATEKAKADEQLAKVERELSAETKLANNLLKYRREVKELNTLLELAMKKLPQKREIPTMLESISMLARNSGLEVRRFAPKTDITKKYFAEVPIDVELRGTFQKVAVFFDEISRMPRIVNVKQLVLNKPTGYSGKEGVEVEIKGVLMTFRYLEPSERPKSEEDEGDKPKKKVRKE